MSKTPDFEEKDEGSENSIGNKKKSFISLYEIENQLNVCSGNHEAISNKPPEEIKKILDQIDVDSIEKMNIIEKPHVNKKKINSIFYSTNVPLFMNIKDFRSFGTTFNCIINSVMVSYFTILSEKTSDQVIHYKYTVAPDTYILNMEHIEGLFAFKVSTTDAMTTMEKVKSSKKNNITEYEINNETPNELCISQHESGKSIYSKNTLKIVPIPLNELGAIITDSIHVINSTDQYVVSFDMNTGLIGNNFSKVIESTIPFTFNFERKKLVIGDDLSKIEMDLFIKTRNELEELNGTHVVRVPSSFVRQSLKKTTGNKIRGFFNPNNASYRSLPYSIIFEHHDLGKTSNIGNILSYMYTIKE
jgi:hypothetical protein